MGAHKAIPTVSLAIIGAAYGLQAIIFILRRKWDMIGWMAFYILAIPVFSFLLPLYSFWKMDDFSWGATRLVLGEKGKKLIVHVRWIPWLKLRDLTVDLYRMKANLTPAQFH